VKRKNRERSRFFLAPIQTYQACRQATGLFVHPSPYPEKSARDFDMNNRLILLLALFATGMTSHAEGRQALEACARDHRQTRTEIDRVHRQYLSIEESPDVARLVVLDDRLRKLLRNRPDCREEDDSGKEKPSDGVIGISIEHYSGSFAYSGKLLAEAYRLSPNSPYRSSTLFSTVEQYSDASSASWDVPNFQAAKIYLREFPDGPFAADAALILATGYKDAYWGLRQESADIGIDQYACVADRLGDLKGKSHDAQLEYAKKMADRYFSQAFRRREPNSHEKYIYESWIDGDPSYSYCPD